MEVLSVDSWGRHQLHGYGFIDLPQEPGNHRRAACTSVFCLTFGHSALRNMLGAQNCLTVIVVGGRK
eukprot:574909-Amphidinium_carterae.1